jgi:hypothetical protein
LQALLYFLFIRFYMTFLSPSSPINLPKINLYSPSKQHTYLQNSVQISPLYQLKISFHTLHFRPPIETKFLFSQKNIVKYHMKEKNDRKSHCCWIVHYLHIKNIAFFLHNYCLEVDRLDRRRIRSFVTDLLAPFWYQVV